MSARWRGRRPGRRRPANIGSRARAPSAARQGPDWRGRQPPGQAGDEQIGIDVVGEDAGGSPSRLAKGLALDDGASSLARYDSKKNPRDSSATGFFSAGSGIDASDQATGGLSHGRGPVGTRRTVAVPNAGASAISSPAGRIASLPSYRGYATAAIPATRAHARSSARPAIAYW